MKALTVGVPRALRSQDCPEAKCFFEQLAVDVQKNPFKAMHRLSDALAATDPTSAAVYKNTLQFAFSPLSVLALDKLGMLSTQERQRGVPDAKGAATYVALAWLGIFRLTRRPDVFSKVLVCPCRASDGCVCSPSITQVRQHMHMFLSHVGASAANATTTNAAAGASPGAALSRIEAATAPHELIDALLAFPVSRWEVPAGNGNNAQQALLKALMAKWGLQRTTRLLCATALCPIHPDPSLAALHDHVLGLLCYHGNVHTDALGVGDLVVPPGPFVGADAATMNPTLVLVPFGTLVHVFASLDMLAHRTVQTLLVGCLRKTTGTTARHMAGRALVSVVNGLVVGATHSHAPPETGHLEALHFCLEVLLRMDPCGASVTTVPQPDVDKGMEPWVRDVYGTALELDALQALVLTPDADTPPQLITVVFSFLRKCLRTARVLQLACADVYLSAVYSQVTAELPRIVVGGAVEESNAMWAEERLLFLTTLSDLYAPESLEILLTLLVNWEQTQSASSMEPPVPRVVDAAHTLLQTLIHAMAHHGHVSRAAQEAILKLSSASNNPPSDHSPSTTSVHSTSTTVVTAPDIAGFGGAVLTQYFGRWLQGWMSPYGAAMVTKCITGNSYFRILFEKHVVKHVVLDNVVANGWHVLPLPEVVHTYTYAILARNRNHVGENHPSAGTGTGLSLSRFAASQHTADCCAALRRCYVHVMLSDFRRGVDSAPATMTAVVGLLGTMPPELIKDHDAAAEEVKGIHTLQHACGELLDHVISTGQLETTEHVDLVLALVSVVL